MKKSCICSIINNDQKYLSEWIDHMLSLGFDDIYLYEDYQSNSHSHIVDKYDNVHLKRVSELENFNNEDNFTHKNLYNWFINQYNIYYEWCLFCNINEFLQLKEGYDLNTFYDEHDKLPHRVVIIYWKVFDGNGYIKSPEGLVVDNYKRRSYNYNFINEYYLYSFFVHINFVYDDLFLNKQCTNIKPIDNVYNTLSNEVVFDFNNDEFLKCVNYNNIDEKCDIWLNVYYTKSWEDWCEDFITYMKGKEYLHENRLYNLDTFFFINKDLQKHEYLLTYYFYKKFNHKFNIKTDFIFSFKYHEKFKHYVSFNMKYMNNLLMKENTDKTAILFLSTKINDVNILKYNSIGFNLQNSYYTLYWCIDDEDKIKEAQDKYNIPNINFFVYSNNDLKDKYGPLFYNGNIDDKVLFNVNYVIMEFFEKLNYEYDYAWLIEYDAIMSDNKWGDLFNNFKHSNSDLITGHIQKMPCHFIMGLRSNNTNNEYSLQSFNPIFRLSARASKLLSDKYKKGLGGYFENAMINIIKDAGMTFEDYGGEGEYVKEKNRNKWYIDNMGSNEGSLTYAEFDIEILLYMLSCYSHLIIHPVKDDQYEEIIKTTKLY